ncbi:unnamed protein product [Musa textilis]
MSLPLVDFPTVVLEPGCSCKDRILNYVCCVLDLLLTPKSLARRARKGNNCYCSLYSCSDRKATSSLAACTGSSRRHTCSR